MIDHRQFFCDVRIADLVASCGGSCSRQACQPLQGDLDSMTCKNVVLNPTCSDANGNLGCPQIRINLARSYVRYWSTNLCARASDQCVL